MQIDIYTDGSCRGNPGPGGWGAVILIGPEELMLANQVENTTNQQMELTAVIDSLNYLTNFIRFEEFSPEIVIYTDSAYLHNCWKDKWWKKWEFNGWKNSKKEPVANRSLWEQLIPWFNKPSFRIVKVKGHSDNKYNILADALATGIILPNH